MQPIRQNDVILLPVQQIEGQKIPHLTLAEAKLPGINIALLRETQNYTKKIAHSICVCFQSQHC